MCVHAPAGWGVPPLPTYYNETKTQQLPKSPSIRRILAALLRFACNLLDPIDAQAPQPRFPPRNTTAHFNFEAMLKCVRAGESWQDSMDRSSAERPTPLASVNRQRLRPCSIDQAKKGFDS